MRISSGVLYDPEDMFLFCLYLFFLCIEHLLSSTLTGYSARHWGYRDDLKQILALNEQIEEGMTVQNKIVTISQTRAGLPRGGSEVVDTIR